MKSSSRVPIPASAESETLTAALSVPSALLVRRHLYFGWLTILIFLTAGLALEALHAFKVEAYLKGFPTKPAG